MSVSWKCLEVLPNELQVTLESLTNEKWRVLQVSPTPAAEPTYSATKFTVVSYRMVYEKGNRPRRNDDYDPEPTQ